MEKVLVILERTDNNYAAYLPELEGCVTTGSNLQEIKESLKEVVSFHLDGMRESGLEIPVAFQNDFVFSYRMDMESFFEWFQGVLTKACISKLTGMNQSLVSQYANGFKKPGKKQIGRIQNAIHAFGRELQQVQFL